MSKDTNEVRRKLLKAAVYMPPIILGSMVATPRTVMGAIGDLKTCTFTDGSTTSITISSGTNACCPCLSKNVGGTIIYAKKYDPKKCAKSQCIKSCGVNCTPGQIATIKCKDFCKNCGTTPVGCKNGPCNCQWVPAKGKFKCI